MFGNESLPSVIYSYGAKAPTLNYDVVCDQMHHAHRYYNVLVEIERQRREQVSAAIIRLSPDLARIDAEYQQFRETIAGLRQQIKALRHRDKKRTPVPRAIKDELAEVQAAYKRCAVARKAAKESAYQSEAAKEALGIIDAEANDKAKAARAESGVYWGTYLQVENSVKQARSSRVPPAFRRWNGDGKLAVQIQGGMTVDEAFSGENTRFRLEPLQACAFDRGTPARFRRTIAWLRVSSDGRDPVWAKIPVTLHRPLPPDASIKWVYLTRRRVACHDAWTLCIVISRAAGWAKQDNAIHGEVGIDVGWRLLDHGLRVAYWVGSDGDKGEVVLPIGDVNRWQKAADLRSIRDKRFNVALESLVAWLDAGRPIPDWLTEKTTHLRQWRSTARLAALTIAWRTQRFGGDAEAFDALESWRKKDKHLYEWEVNQLRKAEAWRLDLYRNLAAMLARRYRVATIENTKWTDLATNGQPEDAEPSLSKYRMRIASPGLLLRIVRERFAETVTTDAAHTTQRCHACGGIVGFDAAANLCATCQHCGATWDQDYNAARNLLAAASGLVAAETP